MTKLSKFYVSTYPQPAQSNYVCIYIIYMLKSTTNNAIGKV